MIENAVLSFINCNLVANKKDIMVWIKIQSAYMNTKHDDFVGNQKILIVPSNRKQENKNGPLQTGNFKNLNVQMMILRATDFSFCI